MGKVTFDNFILFTHKDDKAQSRNEVAIIAHGSQRRNKTFRIDGGDVQFYCPDGTKLLFNPATFLSTHSNYKKQDDWLLRGPVDCPDYDLYKIVGVHLNAATEKMGKTGVSEYITSNSDTARLKGYLDYETLQSVVERGRTECDVVTIRNPGGFSSPPTLKHIVNKLKKEAYGYGVVHWGFCRAADEKAQSWNIVEGRLV